MGYSPQGRRELGTAEHTHAGYSVGGRKPRGNARRRTHPSGLPPVGGRSPLSQQPPRTWVPGNGSVSPAGWCGCEEPGAWPLSHLAGGWGVGGLFLSWLMLMQLALSGFLSNPCSQRLTQGKVGLADCVFGAEQASRQLIATIIAGQRGQGGWAQPPPAPWQHRPFRSGHVDVQKSSRWRGPGGIPVFRGRPRPRESAWLW